MTNPLHALIDALRYLPGVGPKSARRMAYHLLQHQRHRGLDLAQCLNHAMNVINHCNDCNNFTEQSLCHICQNDKRNHGLLCIVESPTDIEAVEQSQAFDGLYFVLMGKISPIDGIGPDEIGLHKLKQLIVKKNISEVIIAISPSIEGHVTSHFIHECLEGMPLKLTQLAQGIPTGGELEYLDANTIGYALKNRGNIQL